MRRSFVMGRLDQALVLFSDVKRAVYQTSKGRCPEDYLYVMALGGIGEMILTCSQTHHLRTKHPVCFLVRSDRFWMTRLWPNSADLFIQVDPNQVQMLSVLEDHSFLVPGHLFISYITWLADGRFADQLILRDKLLGFREAFAFGLGLPLDSPFEPPRLVNKQIAWQPGPKSVLIMPHANFTRKLPQGFWRGLAQDFVDRGHEVFFETFGSEPIEMPGVTNIETEVLDFLSLAARCSAVVMLRSGLSDLLSAHSQLIPDLNLIILWHLDPATEGTLIERWHAPGCSVGFPSSKSWFDCGDNVNDVEVDPTLPEWQQHPVQQLLPYLSKAGPSAPGVPVAAP